MSEDTDIKISTKDLPQIVFQKTTSTLEDQNYINIEVRGTTLEECRKHFDEIYEMIK